MPVNKKYPIADLMDACLDYIDRTGRRISIEWALIDGVNDTHDQAVKLAELLKGKLFHVNLIRLNPVKHYSGKPSDTDQSGIFQNILLDAGIAKNLDSFTIMTPEHRFDEIGHRVVLEVGRHVTDTQAA